MNNTNTGTELITQIMIGQMTVERMIYQIIDIQTQAVVGTRKSRKAARNRADKLDTIYGATRYTVRAAS